MTPQEQAIIVYARAAYGFLLGHDYDQTNEALAREIAEYYDIVDEPRSKEVYEVLMRYPDLKGDK